MNTLKDIIDSAYQEWMFNKWAGFQTKDRVIKMIERSYDWELFCEEVREIINTEEGEK